MNQRVEERVQPEHPANFDQRVPSEDLSKRCDGQCDQQEDERHHAGRSQKELDRVCTERAAICVECREAQAGSSALTEIKSLVKL